MTAIAPELTADEVIAQLQLSPHPEGGCYRETFRDATSDATGRSASTAIYFLLREGEISAWHRIDAAELWHWYAGAPLALETADAAGSGSEQILGTQFQSGQRPLGIVLPHQWQRARSLGAWSLVGCTVAPGFEFASFQLAADDSVFPVGRAK
jgi:predicted cupin superfamily sugar epimerase